LPYERIETLATLRGLDRAGWDALGQQLVVEFVAGPPDRAVRWPVGLTREAAVELLHVLQTCLAEKEGEAQSAQ